MNVDEIEICSLPVLIELGQVVREYDNDEDKTDILFFVMKETAHAISKVKSRSYVTGLLVRGLLEYGDESVKNLIKNYLDSLPHKLH